MTVAVCYIVGAGENCGLDFQPEPEDLVIAADGGYEALRQAGIRPHLVIGDFDSLGEAPAQEQVITLPAVKDVTDTWAAIELGKERGYEAFWRYGCTGGRFGHTLANVQTLAALANEGMQGWMVSREQIVTAISGKTLHFGAEQQGFLSLFSHTDRCAGVTVRGMKYPLENAVLHNLFPLGVSNEFLGEEAWLTVEEGIAIVVYGRTKNG